MVTVGVASRAEALLPLPGEARGRHPVRTRHISQRPAVFGHIGKEIPGLRGGMEGVGMKQGLWIAWPPAGLGKDRVDKAYRLRVGRGGIAKQSLEQPPAHECAKLGMCVHHGAGDRDEAGDGIALQHFLCRKFMVLHLIAQPREDLGRQGVAAHHIAVAGKILGILAVDQMGQSPPSAVSHALGFPQARNVQSALIEPGASDQRIGFEGFGAAGQFRQPNRRPDHVEWFQRKSPAAIAVSCNGRVV